MDIIQHNQEIFLKKVDNYYNVLMFYEKNNLYINWKQNSTKLINELDCLIDSLCKKYDNLRIENKVDQLKYIHFSMLYTSFLDKFPCIKINFYDHYWFTSTVECYAYWYPKEIFEIVYYIQEKLNEYFKKQTAAPTYHIDHYVFRSAKELEKIFIYFLQQFFKDYLIKKNICQVDVFFGEFLDKFFLIYGGE